MYSVNLNYFNNIQTEQQAYILAWYWSRGHGRIQIHQRDIDILYFIKQELEYTGPITLSNSISSLNITLPAFQTQLFALGCNVNKITPTFYPIISDELVRHFLRGIFDSYGHFVMCKHKYINVGITYNNLFLKYLSLYLKEQFNIKSAVLDNRFMITKVSFTKVFLDFIYREASCYSVRKHSKYLKFSKVGV